ncbi:MAG: hypothetical protein ACOYLI_11360 [Synechococcus lacustris]
MRFALLALAAGASVISLLPAPAAADTLSKEKYLNDEGGVVLTCKTPKDNGLMRVWENCGDCEYYALYSTPVPPVTSAYRVQEGVRGLW